MHPLTAYFTADLLRCYGGGGPLMLGTPKSHQSRTVPIPRFLASQLAELAERRKAEDLVFTTPAAPPSGCPTGAATHSTPPGAAQA